MESATRAQVEILYFRYSAMVHHRCTRLLGGDAWDATQDVFARAMRYYGSIRTAASPSIWLLRTSTDHCVNVLQDHSDPSNASSVPIRALLPRHAPEVQRFAIHHHIDAMTTEEVATLCDVSVSRVRKKLDLFLRRSQRRFGKDLPCLPPPAPPDGCPSDWTLQRCALDELLGDEREAVAIHVAQCERCRGELAGLDGRREAFLEEHPFAEAEAEISERALFLPDDPETAAEHPAWTKARVALAALAAGAAAVVIATVFAPGPVDTDTDTDSGAHAHALVVRVDAAGEVRALTPASPPAQEEDALEQGTLVTFTTDEPIAPDDVVALVRTWLTEGGVGSLPKHASEGAFGGRVEVHTQDRPEH